MSPTTHPCRLTPFTRFGKKPVAPATKCGSKIEVASPVPGAQLPLPALLRPTEIYADRLIGAPHVRRGAAAILGQPLDARNR
jgi:hypothetical protein